jgi:hypothetical protein
MKKSKYYIDRYKLNTQSQYFYRGNLSDDQLIKSAKGLSDIARKRLKSFEESNIDPQRYSNLSRVYNKAFMRKRKDTALSDSERRKYMYYINELEEIMFERHMTKREVLKDYNRAVKDYNEKLGLNLNNKQYLQFINIVNTIKKIKPDIASEQIIDLAHQYSHSTRGVSTISKKRLLQTVDKFLEKQESIARGKKKKDLHELRGEFSEQYKNKKSRRGSTRSHREVTKVSTGNAAPRKKNRRFKR